MSPGGEKIFSGQVANLTKTAGLVELSLTTQFGESSREQPKTNSLI